MPARQGLHQRDASPRPSLYPGLRPHYTPSDPTFRQKLFWWRQGYDWHAEPQPKITVTGRRLDSSAPPLLSDRANNGWVQEDQPFMVVGINFPTLGCWEIKGHYQDDELTFVVWVAQYPWFLCFSCLSPFSSKHFASGSLKS